MSYDVYFWYRATGDIREVLDEVAEEDFSHLEPHPSVSAFRHDLLALLPNVGDVIEPRDESPGALSHVVLTLPFGWVAQLPQVLELAAKHGLVGWDPQMDEPIGPQPGPAARPAPSLVSDGDPRRWTVEHFGGLIGAKSLSRAWSLAGLEDEVGFGEAVGVFILAMAMCDGVRVNGTEARRAVASVAADCALGVPTKDVTIQIGYCMTDVTGFARAVADGHF